LDEGGLKLGWSTGTAPVPSPSQGDVLAYPHSDHHGAFVRFRPELAALQGRLPDYGRRRSWISAPGLRRTPQFTGLARRCLRLRRMVLPSGAAPEPGADLARFRL